MSNFVLFQQDFFMQPLIKIPDVAVWLNVSEKTVYRMVKEVTIPFIPVKGGVRFDPGQLEQWLQKRAVKPKNAI